MNRKKVIFSFNAVLICVMIIHVGVKMYLHSQHPEYGSPIYMELINAVYYLVPLLIINIVNFVLKKR